MKQLWLNRKEGDAISAMVFPERDCDIPHGTLFVTVRAILERS